MAEITNFFNVIINVISTINIADIIDILIVTYIIYKLMKLAKNTRSGQLIKGIVLILLAFLLAKQFGLKTIGYILSELIQVGILVIVVLFQPELRRALEQVGRTRFSKISVFSGPTEDDEEINKRLKICINSICEACEFLSQQEIGALIVLEKGTNLTEIIDTGTVINATPSSQIISNVFFPMSPLHDGAMIIRNGYIYAAGCFLPLTENKELHKSLGTRHRAAVGMSENSDAIIVIVSEETGIVSVAQNGKLARKFTTDMLRELLYANFVEDKKIYDKKLKFRRSKSK